MDVFVFTVGFSLADSVPAMVQELCFDDRRMKEWTLWRPVGENLVLKSGW